MRIFINPAKNFPVFVSFYISISCDYFSLIHCFALVKYVLSPSFENILFMFSSRELTYFKINMCIQSKLNKKHVRCNNKVSTHLLFFYMVSLSILCCYHIMFVHKERQFIELTVLQAEKSKGMALASGKSSYAASQS